MKAATFGRRSSNAQSSHAASQSSSSPPSMPMNQYNQLGTIPHTPTSSFPGNASLVSIGQTVNPTAAHFGSEGISEFGSLGGIPTRSGGGGREGSIASPSLSPTLGGSQATFPPPGPSAIPGQLGNLDTQSLPSGTNSTFTTSTFVGSSFGVGQHTDSVLQETFARRIRCLSYLKRCMSTVSLPSRSQAAQSANSPAWLDVIKLSKRDIEAVYDSEKMKKRANRNYLLGCSMATTMDYNSSTEFAKVLLTILNDAENMGEGNDRDKTKMKNFFKASIRGTRRGGLSDWEGGLGSAGMAVTGSGGLDLHQGNAPFSFDYFQTTFTLFDILVEMYHKFNWFLTSDRDVGNNSTAKEFDTNTELGQSTNVTVSTMDTMNKIDVKVKKILSQTCKELDSLARHVIREELASIDPIMARDLGLLDGTHTPTDPLMQQSLDY